MFCENCGQKYKESEKFCTQCGNQIGTPTSTVHQTIEMKVKGNDRWYHRLGMVIYVFFNILFIPVVFAVWSENSTTYVSDVGYKYHYEDSYGLAFWYSFLTIVIWLLVLRLTKSALRYIVSGKKFKFKDLLFF